MSTIKYICLSALYDREGVKKPSTAMVLTLGSGGNGEIKQGIGAARGSEATTQVSGLGSGLADGMGMGDGKPVIMEKPEASKEKTRLVNKAGESRSPYVSHHKYAFRV